MKLPPIPSQEELDRRDRLETTVTLLTSALFIVTVLGIIVICMAL